MQWAAAAGSAGCREGKLVGGVTRHVRRALVLVKGGSLVHVIAKSLCMLTQILEFKSPDSDSLVSLTII